MDGSSAAEAAYLARVRTNMTRAERIDVWAEFVVVRDECLRLAWRDHLENEHTRRETRVIMGHEPACPYCFPCLYGCQCPWHAEHHQSLLPPQRLYVQPFACDPGETATVRKDIGSIPALRTGTQHGYWLRRRPVPGNGYWIAHAFSARRRRSHCGLPAPRDVYEVPVPPATREWSGWGNTNGPKTYSCPICVGIETALKESLKPVLEPPSLVPTPPADGRMNPARGPWPWSRRRGTPPEAPRDR